MQYSPEYLRGILCRPLEFCSLWAAFSSPVLCPMISSQLGLFVVSASSLHFMEPFGFHVGYSLFCGLQTLHAVGWAIERFTLYSQEMTVLHCPMSTELKTTIIPLPDSIMNLTSILPIFYFLVVSGGRVHLVLITPCQEAEVSSFTYSRKKKKEGYCG